MEEYLERIRAVMTGNNKYAYEHKRVVIDDRFSPPRQYSTITVLLPSDYYSLGDSMRVYRVENTEGKGPYTAWDKGKTRMAYVHTDDMHPGPWASFNRKVEKDEKFGCPSMNALFTWFGGWLPMMIRDGFKVTVIDLPDNGKWETDGMQVIYVDAR